MKIIDKTFPPAALPDHLPFSASPADLALIDIETTGLSPDRGIVYLIGMITCRSDKTRQFRQYFAQTRDEEAQILSRFFQDLSGKRVLVEYNGDRFDIPFLMKRSEKLSVPCPLMEMSLCDLYRIVHPLQNFLGLIDGRQQTVEKMMGTGRIEDRSGKDLIAAYLDYTASGSESMENLLLSHNEADVLGLSCLMNLLSYDALFHCEGGLSLSRVETQQYEGLDGMTRIELLLHFHPADPFPAPLLGIRDGCLLRADRGEGIIKVPMEIGELKYFYANYREYWYFPEQDEAIHRSVAQFAERSHRIPATPATCYTRKNGVYLPEWNDFARPVFRASSDSAEIWFELTADRKKDPDFFRRYAGYVLTHIIRQRAQQKKHR